MIIGDFIRLAHDGSWSMWKCRRCGKVQYFTKCEEPDGKCECQSETDGEQNEIVDNEGEQE